MPIFLRRRPLVNLGDYKDVTWMLLGDFRDISRHLSEDKQKNISKIC